VIRPSASSTDADADRMTLDEEHFDLLRVIPDDEGETDAKQDKETVEAERMDTNAKDDSAKQETSAPTSDPGAVAAPAPASSAEETSLAVANPSPSSTQLEPQSSTNPTPVPTPTTSKATEAAPLSANKHDSKGASPLRTIAILTGLSEEQIQFGSDRVVVIRRKEADSASVVENDLSYKVLLWRMVEL
jgi:hypothetical protein